MKDSHTSLSTEKITPVIGGRLGRDSLELRALRIGRHLKTTRTDQKYDEKLK